MRSSAMRDLMAVTARPEVISLAGGLPDTSTFPPESLAAQMSKIAAESAAAALQYGPTEGFDETKDCIVEVMAAEGMLPDPDDIVVTTGGQQAIDLVTKTLVDPGDVVICEAPTYPGAVPVFCSYQADVRQVEMDEDGMRIDLLEELLAELRAEGRRPKFIYTVPSFQNPGGVTLSLERRARLVELARLHEMLVVEDNPYGMLRYGGEALPPLYQLDGGDFVIYLGTFSKILSPGIRLGWVVAPPPVLEKIVLGKGAADLCTSTLTQFFVRQYFAEGGWKDYVASLVDLYRGRRDTMLEALAEHFPAEATWTEPEGGLFIWATLPDYIDTGDLLAKALRSDVAFVPGTGGLRRRPREELDAPELQRRHRRRNPRGDRADRPRDQRTGRALRVPAPDSSRARHVRTRSGGHAGDEAKAKSASDGDRNLTTSASEADQPAAITKAHPSCRSARRATQ